MIAPTQILYVDQGGSPISWIGWRAAATLMTSDRVGWFAGQTAVRIAGGVSAATGRQTTLDIPSIVAGRLRFQRFRDTPPLINSNLFARDRHTCMYCGASGPAIRLTRDHVIPRCQGGEDRWTNVVTACATCNTRKGGRTPDQAGMPLLAVPYRPTWSEYLILANRRILADQMEFLTAFLPERSPWR